MVLHVGQAQWRYFLVFSVVSSRSSLFHVTCVRGEVDVLVGWLMRWAVGPKYFLTYVSGCISEETGTLAPKAKSKENLSEFSALTR